MILILPISMLAGLAILVWAIKARKLRLRTVLITCAVTVSIVLAALFFYRQEIRDFVEQDRCLDAGGKWDEVSRVCQMQETEDP